MSVSADAGGSRSTGNVDGGVRFKVMETEDTAAIYHSLEKEIIAPGMKVVNLERGYTSVAVGFVRKAVGEDTIKLRTVKEYDPNHEDNLRGQGLNRQGRGAGV